MARKVVYIGLSLWVLFLLVSTTVLAALPFSDIEESFWGAPYIESLVEKGIVNGYKDGTFRPGNTLNRAELAKIAVEIAISEGYIENTQSTLSSDPFFDVPSSAWFANYVRLGVEYNLFSGYADGDGNPTGYFGPGDVVTRAQALKVLLAAQGMTEDGLLNPGTSFPDVPMDSWFYEAVTTAYNYRIIDGFPDGSFGPEKPVNRVEIAKIAYQASPMVRSLREVPSQEPASSEDDIVIDTGLDTEPSEEPSQAQLNVIVKPEVADVDSRAIPRGATNVTFLKFKIHAPTDRDATLQSLTVSRKGVGNSDDFDAVYLLIDGKRYGNTKTFVSNTQKATFTFASNSPQITAGSVASLEVRADMNPDGSLNGEHYLTIGASDVTFVDSDGEVIQTTFESALSGTTFRSVDVEVGTLEISRGTSPPANASVGADQVPLGELRMQASGDEDILIRSITLENDGSINANEITNLTLYNNSNNEVLAGPVYMNNDRVFFDFTSLPDGGFVIQNGDTRRIGIRGDIVGGVGSTIEFRIDELGDIDAVGLTYGVGVTVIDEAGANGFGTVTTLGGELTFDFSQPEFTEVPVGRDEVPLAILNVSNRGESVLVRDFRLTLERTTQASGSKAFTSGARFFRSIRLVDENGSTVAGPVDLSDFSQGTDSALIRFRSEFLIPSSVEPKKYYVQASTGDSLMEGEEYRVGFNPGASTNLRIEGLLSGDDVPSSSLQQAYIASHKIRVEDERLYLSLLSSPRSSSLVRGGEARILGFALRAGSSGRVRVTSLQFDPSDSATYVAGDTITFSLLDSNGTVVDTDTITGNDRGPRFDRLNNLMLEPGSQKTFYVSVKTASAAVQGHVIALALPAKSTSIAAEDVDGNVLDSNQLFAGNTAGGSLNKTAIVAFTFSDGGGLIASLDTTAGDSAQVSLGGEEVFLGEFQFQASDDVINIEKFELSALNAEQAQNVEYLYLYVDDVQVGGAQPLGTVNHAVWTFSNANRITVPADGRKRVQVRGTLNSGNNDTGVAGTSVQLYLRSMEARGTGTKLIPDWNSSRGDHSNITLTEVSSTVFGFAGTLTPNVGDLVVVTDGSNTEHAMVLGVKTAATSEGDVTGLANNQILVVRNVNGTTNSVLGAATFTPGANGDTLSIKSRLLSEAVLVVNGVFNISEDIGFTPQTQGAPIPDMDVWRLRLSGGSNSSVVDTRLKKLRLTVSGSAIAENFRLIDHGSGRVVATGTGKHGGLNLSTIDFDLSASDDRDRLITAGNPLVYRIRANVNSNGATGGNPTSLNISIANFGSVSASSFPTDTHVVWEDINRTGNNGAGRITEVFWVDAEYDRLEMTRGHTFTSIGGDSVGTTNTTFTVSSVTVANGGVGGQFDTGDTITIVFNEALTPASIGLAGNGTNLSSVASGATGGIDDSGTDLVLTNILQMTVGDSIAIAPDFETNVALSADGKTLTITIEAGVGVVTNPVALNAGTALTGTVTSIDEDGDPDTVYKDPDNEALTAGAITITGTY